MLVSGRVLLINGIYWGYNPLILNFDPNFRPGTSKKIHSTQLFGDPEIQKPPSASKP